jgi:hypothetical protein
LIEYERCDALRASKFGHLRPNKVKRSVVHLSSYEYDRFN